MERKFGISDKNSINSPINAGSFAFADNVLAFIH